MLHLLMVRTLRSRFNRKTPTYQPIGNDANSPCPSVLQNDLQEQSHSYCLKKYLHDVLHNQTGWYKICRTYALMWRILTWCNLNNVTLRARHVVGSLNVIADGLSRRNQIQSTERYLSPQIFKQVSKIWESPQVDLFATSLNTNFLCTSLLSQILRLGR